MDLPMLSVDRIAVRLLAALLVATLHGATLAWAAARWGDAGPRRDGRGRWSPWVHLDLFGLVHAVFFRIVWPAPLAIDPDALRGGRRGAVAVVLSGGAALLLLSIVALAIRPAVTAWAQDAAAIHLSTWLLAVAEIGVLSAVAHLLPLPPFAAALLTPWAPRHPQDRRAAGPSTLGIIAIFAASLLGATTWWSGPLLAAWFRLLGF